MGVVLLLASLDSSVDRSVLKLALDRRRSSLKFKKDGAMTEWQECEPYVVFAPGPVTVAMDNKRVKCRRGMATYATRKHPEARVARECRNQGCMYTA